MRVPEPVRQAIRLLLERFGFTEGGGTPSPIALVPDHEIPEPAPSLTVEASGAGSLGIGGSVNHSTVVVADTAYITQGTDSESVRQVERALVFQQRARAILERVDRLVDDAVGRLLVGRRLQLDELDLLVDEGQSGRAFVTASAGFGKTALLAHWVRERQAKGDAVAYHFFSSERHTDLIGSRTECMRSLLEQVRATTGALPVRDYDAALASSLSDVVGRFRKSHHPLIIVVDGLDEADAEFEPPFPDELPEGVFIVASARTDAFSISPTLSAWARSALHLTLSRLSLAALEEFLRSDSSPEVRALADDAALVTQLDAITQGFPLYLSFLVEDLREAVATQVEAIGPVLTHAPIHFSEYIHQQFKRLAWAQSLDDKTTTDLFALLTVALGPMELEAISAITGLDEVHLATLPRKVARWFTVSRSSPDSSDLYSFAHPLLAYEFKKLLKVTAPKLEQKVIEFCLASWSTDSVYARRHLVEHLSANQRWPDVLTLALSPEFLAAQRRLPSGEELVIATLRRGLKAAVLLTYWGPAAELAMRLGHSEESRPRDLPLAASRRGDHEQAWVLISDLEPTTRVLMSMLVCGSLVRGGQLEPARRLARWLTSEGGRQPETASLRQELYRDLVRFLLSDLSPVFSPDALAALSLATLDTKGVAQLARKLAGTLPPRYAEAFLSRHAEVGGDRVHGLSDRLLAPDALDDARAILARRAADEHDSELAERVARAVVDNTARWDLFADLALAYAEQGLRAESMAALRHVDHLTPKFVLKVLRVLSRLGEHEKAAALAAELADTSRASLDAGEWFIQLEILKWKDEVGVEDPASITPSKLWEVAGSLDSTACAVASVSLLQHLFSRGVSGNAIMFQRSVPERLRRVEDAELVASLHSLLGCALSSAGERSIARDEFDAAVELALGLPAKGIGTACDVAVQQSQCMPGVEAISTFARIRAAIEETADDRHLSGRGFDLVRLASAYGEVGMKTEARATLQEATSLVEDVFNERPRSILDEKFADAQRRFIAVAYARLGLLTEASGTVERISDPDEVFATTATVAAVLSQTGKVAEAESLVEAVLLRRPDPREELLEQVGEVLLRISRIADMSADSEAVDEALAGAAYLNARAEFGRPRYRELWRIYLHQALLGLREPAEQGISRLLEEVESAPGEGTIYREFLEDLVSMPDGARSSVLLLDTFEGSLGNPELIRLFRSILRDVSREIGPRAHEYDDNFREAVEQLEQEQMQSFRAAVFSELSIIYWRIAGASADESVRGLLSRAVAGLDEDSDNFPLASILLAASWVGVDDWLKDISVSSLPRTFPLRDWLFHDIGVREAEAGRFQSAQEYAEAIDDPWLAAHVLRLVVVSARAQGIAEVEDILLRLQPKIDSAFGVAQVRTTMEAAIAFAADGRADQAMQFLEQATDRFAMITDWTEVGIRLPRAGEEE